jgi:hypothetical protein
MVFALQLCALLLHFVGLIWDQPSVSDPALETHTKKEKIHNFAASLCSMESRKPNPFGACFKITV